MSIKKTGLVSKLKYKKCSEIFFALYRANAEKNPTP